MTDINQPIKYVNCINCLWGGREVNYLIECHNTKINPAGFKKSRGKRICAGYKAKTG